LIVKEWYILRFDCKGLVYIKSKDYPLKDIKLNLLIVIVKGYHILRFDCNLLHNIKLKKYYIFNYQKNILFLIIFKGNFQKILYFKGILKKWYILKE
jgi:hypothetical protein